MSPTQSSASGVPAPFEILNDEHRFIERLISALLAYVEQLGSWADPVDLGRFVDLIQGFADARHHEKEEDILFEAMIAAGFPREMGPIAVMRMEHDHGRRLVAALRAVADKPGPWTAADKVTVRESAQDYASLLRQHIVKEDTVLYPMARRTLSAEAVTRMEAQFDEVEGGEDARAELEGFLATANTLFEKYLGAPPLSLSALSIRTMATPTT